MSPHGIGSLTFSVDVDLVLRFVPPMDNHSDGIRLTRTIELPFPPAEDISIFSKEWEGEDFPLGYVLKNVTWEIDRDRFLADTLLSVTGTPIAMIPFEIRKRTVNPFLPVWIVLDRVNSGHRAFSGEVIHERAGAGLA